MHIFVIVIYLYLLLLQLREVNGCAVTYPLARPSLNIGLPTPTGQIISMGTYSGHMPFIISCLPVRSEQATKVDAKRCG